MKVNIEISDHSTGHWVPNHKLCRRWIGQALSAARRGGATAVSLRFVNRDESQALNLRYRKRGSPTNVLAFPSAIPASLGELLGSEPLGDIVVCSELAQREARAQGKALEHHWAHLLVHGCLHLLGYDHEIDTEAEAMEKMETEILRNLGIPDPYPVS